LLSLNIPKTSFIIFCPVRNNFALPIKLNNVDIKQTNTFRFLGLTIDSQLNWHIQVENICSNLAICNYVVWQLRDHVSIFTPKAYYFAYKQSKIGYGIICWSNSNRINEVLLIQKKILRTMMFMGKRDSCREVFKLLKILTCVSLYILNCVIDVQANLVKFTNKFHSNRQMIDQYILRENSLLLLSKHRLAMVAASSRVLPLKAYNHLPKAYRDCANPILL